MTPPAPGFESEPVIRASGGLEGTAFLVTGGGSGIGRACAAALSMPLSTTLIPVRTTLISATLDSTSRTSFSLALLRGRWSERC